LISRQINVKAVLLDRPLILKLNNVWHALISIPTSMAKAVILVQQIPFGMLQPNYVKNAMKVLNLIKIKTNVSVIYKPHT
jgi:hypothetical protein